MLLVAAHNLHPHPQKALLQHWHNLAITCYLVDDRCSNDMCHAVLLASAGVCLVAGGMGVSRQQVLHAAGGDRGVSHHQHQHHHAAAAALAHEVWQQQPVLVEVPVDVR